MRLLYDPNPSRRYPNGYWYARTDDGDYDADGDTPLNAVTALCIVLEKAVKG